MPESPNVDRQEQARELLADCVRNADEGSSHEALLAAHPELRDELAREIGKLNLIHGALQRVSAPDGEDTTPVSVSCPSCHESVSADSISRSEHGADVTICNACGETFAVVTEPVREFTGQRFDRFELLQRIGVGGFGSVWRAKDPSLDRVVALKLPRSGLLSEEETRAFLREARTAAQLKHANIVRVHDVGQHDDTTFIVSDLIDGLSLDERLTIRAFSPRHAAELCVKVARAMQYAHDAGVIHRDLKPQNILIDEKGEPFVTDFGLARRDAIDITVTAEGAILGTPAFMAPEQARGESHAADSRTDVYSLGAILFQLLTGELPFRGNAADVLRQVVNEPPPRLRRLNSRIPVDLETICLKCLEKKPEQRYATMGALADDLQRWLDHKPIAARPVGPFGRAQRWCVRKPALAASLGFLTLALVVGVAGITWQWRKTEAALVREQTERTRANENLRAAGSVVDEFLGSVGDLRLNNQPGVAQLRRELLSKATEYYESIANSNSNDPRLRLQSALAHKSLSNLSREDGERATATAHAESSLDILESLDNHPDLEQLDVDRVRAAALIARGFATGAIDDFLQAHTLLDRLLQQHPDDEKLLRYDAQAIALIGTRYRRTRPDEAVSMIELAVDRWQQIIDAFPNDPHHYDHQGRSLLDLALLYMDQESQELALQFAKRAADVQQQGLAIASDYWPCRSTLAFSLGTMARAHSAMARYEEAIEFYNRAIEHWLAIVDAFPTSVMHPNNLGNQYGRVANVYLKLGKVDLAREAVQHELVIRNRLCEQVPDHDQTRWVQIDAKLRFCRVLLEEADFQGCLDASTEIIQLLDTSDRNQTTTGLSSLAHSLAARARLELPDSGTTAESHLLQAVELLPYEFGFAPLELNPRRTVADYVVMQVSSDEKFRPNDFMQRLDELPDSINTSGNVAAVLSRILESVENDDSIVVSPEQLAEWSAMARKHIEFMSTDEQARRIYDRADRYRYLRENIAATSADSETSDVSSP